MNGFLLNGIYGFKIVKFPSDSVLSTTTWAKQSYYKSSQQPYALVFGENENYIFVFGFQNNKCLVHKIQTSDGSSLWTRGFTCSNDQSLMDFKNLGLSTYSLVAIGGNNQIDGMKFARLTMAPDNTNGGTMITSSDYYTDPIWPYYIKTRGLKIVDKDVANAILLDTSTLQSFFSTINFTSNVMTYKQFSSFYDYKSGSFINTSKYVFGTYGVDVFMNMNNKTFLQTPSIFTQG